MATDVPLAVHRGLVSVVAIGESVADIREYWRERLIHDPKLSFVLIWQLTFVSQATPLVIVSSTATVIDFTCRGGLGCKAACNERAKEFLNVKIRQIVV